MALVVPRAASCAQGQEHTLRLLDLTAVQFARSQQESDMVSSSARCPLQSRSTPDEQPDLLHLAVQCGEQHA